MQRGHLWFTWRQTIVFPGAAGIDLKELRSVGSADQVRVLVFVKQRETGMAQYLEIGKNDQRDVHLDLGKLDSGDPNTVKNFVHWGIENAPARRYALVLWNHGGGWVPDDLEQLYEEVRADGHDTGVTRGEVNFLAKGRVGRAIFKKTIKRILKLPTARDRAICNDDTSGHSIDVERILRNIAKLTGRQLDLFGMDACLMSTLEVAYQLRDLTDVVVGSEELEPGAGWKYDAILKALTANPDMDGRKLGFCVVQTYVDSYRDDQAQWPVTQCAVDTRNIGAFTLTLGSFQKAVTEELPVVWPMVQRAHARSVRFMFDLADLRSFCKQLAATDVSDKIKSECQTLLTTLEPGCAIRRLHRGRRPSRPDR
jgi:Clostripain family